MSERFIIRFSPDFPFENVIELGDRDVMYFQGMVINIFVD
jgi:hypothetical protein